MEDDQDHWEQPVRMDDTVDILPSEEELRKLARQAKGMPQTTSNQEQEDIPEDAVDMQAVPPLDVNQGNRAVPPDVNQANQTVLPTLEVNQGNQAVPDVNQENVLNQPNSVGGNNQDEIWQSLDQETRAQKRAQKEFKEDRAFLSSLSGYFARTRRGPSSDYEALLDVFGSLLKMTGKKEEVFKRLQNMKTKYGRLLDERGHDELTKDDNMNPPYQLWMKIWGKKNAQPGGEEINEQQDEVAQDDPQLENCPFLSQALSSQLWFLMRPSDSLPADIFRRSLSRLDLEIKNKLNDECREVYLAEKEVKAKRIAIIREHSEVLLYIAGFS